MSTMLINTFVLLSLIASTSAEPQLGALIGKIAGKTNPKPRPQEQPQLPSKPNGNNPNGNKPNGNKPQDPPPANPNLAQAQAQVNNVAGLNKRWELAETIADVADLGYSIADAILGTAQTTTALATVPNPTSWATAFAPCKRYASILSSCATATASFYDLEYDQQASCVCYQASTNTAACQAVPTLDLSYDVDEYQCWNFLNKTGAIAIADVMDQALVLPGPVLCDWAISQTDFSMPSTLSPTTVTCAVSTPTPTAPVAARVGDQAAQLLTASDVQILAMLALLCSAFSGLLFL
jgi:hypothetical protein